MRDFENFGQCGVARCHALPTARSLRQEGTELLPAAGVTLPHSQVEPWPPKAMDQLCKFPALVSECFVRFNDSFQMAASSES